MSRRRHSIHWVRQNKAAAKQPRLISHDRAFTPRRYEPREPRRARRRRRGFHTW
jgi:hypothetical protein